MTFEAASLPPSSLLLRISLLISGGNNGANPLFHCDMSLLEPSPNVCQLRVANKLGQNTIWFTVVVVTGLIKHMQAT